MDGMTIIHTTGVRYMGDRGRPLQDGLAWVDLALEEWAKWGKQGLDGLGWPTATLLARVAEMGFTGAAQRGAPMECGEGVDATERAVLRLKAIERKVIIKHYLHWQPVEASARACHMTPGRFRTVLHRARRSVGDYMEGLRYNK